MSVCAPLTSPYIVTLTSLTQNNRTASSLFFSLYEVMMCEVLQVLRGAGKVGSALVTTQGEQLRLMACNSTMGAGVKVAQDVVEGLVGTFMGGSNTVRNLTHHPMDILI